MQCGLVYLGKSNGVALGCGYRGHRIAVLSPSFAAAGAFPAVHEQAMRRLADVTGLLPVEYPTTRKVGAAPQERAADINAAFADPAVRGILAVVGGEDQITVIPHLDAGSARRDPKPFLGTSDNTNRTWGGCLEVIEQILAAGRFPFGPGVLDGAVLLLETSEELLPARNVGWIVRALGERGILGAAAAVLVARPPVSDFTRRPPPAERARLRPAL